MMADRYVCGLTGPAVALSADGRQIFASIHFDGGRTGWCLAIKCIIMQFPIARETISEKMHAEYNLQVWYLILKIVATVIAIVGGLLGIIYTLKKHEWHVRAAAFLVGISPLALNIIGMGAFWYWNAPIIACILLLAGIIAHATIFMINPRPVIGGEVLWLVVSVGLSVSAILFVLCASVIDQIMGALSALVDILVH